MKLKSCLLALLFLTSANLLLAQGGDEDNDGVPDSEDVCPSEKGTKENKGCPGKGTATTAGDYQQSLDKLNKFLEFFDGGSYGKIQVQGDSVYQKSRYGTVSSIHQKDLLMAVIKYNAGAVHLLCKYSAYCIYVSENNGKYENYITFSSRNPYDFPQLANLLNNFVFDLKKVPQQQRLIYNNDGTIKQNYTFLEANNGTIDNNYTTPLEKLNNYLSTFNNGGSTTFLNVKGDSVIITSAGTYVYSVHKKDVDGAVIEEWLKVVSISCRLGEKKIVTPYQEMDSRFSFSQRAANGMNAPFNYAELANLLNKFLFAFKKQPIPDLLVYDETKYIKPSTVDKDQVKIAKNPLDKAIAEFNVALKEFSYNNDYLKKISLSENRDVITFEYYQSRPFIILDRIADMTFESNGNKDRLLKISSSSKGYCYCYENFNCKETYSFYDLTKSKAEKFYQYFGNILDAWNEERKIKSAGLTYAEKFKKMQSSDFVWEIEEGKNIQLTDATKAENEYKKLKKLVGAAMTSRGLYLNSDLETFRGTIITADNKSFYVKSIKVTPVAPVLVSRSIGLQNLGNGFYEHNDPSLFKDGFFAFKKKLYHTNVTDNRIEEIDLETGQAKAILQLDRAEKIVTAAATDNYIYYATSNGLVYVLYRFNPLNNETVQLEYKHYDKLNYKENPTQGEKYSIGLEGLQNRVNIYYSQSIINLTSGFTETIGKYYTTFDNDPTVRITDFRKVFNPDFRTKPYEYYGTPGAIGIKDDKMLFNDYKDKDGKYHKLAVATYNSTTAQYSNMQQFPIKPETMVVDKVIEFGGEVFAIVSFWDVPSSGIKKRQLFKLKETGQLTGIGNLGNGPEDDYLSYYFTDDDLFIRSFSSIYRYNLSFKSLREIVVYDKNTVIRTDLYPTHNGNFVFEKFTKDPSGPVEKMVYSWKTEKATPITDVLNSNPDIKATNDPYNVWIKTNKYNYVLKRTNDKRVLYKLDFINNKAEQLVVPDIGNYKFKEITDYKFLTTGNSLWLKAKYENNGKSEEKLIVYKCE